MQSNQPQQAASPKRVSGSIFMVPLLAVILMLWLFALHMYPDVYDRYGYGLSLDMWRTICYLIFIILIAVIFMAIMSSGNPGVVVSSQDRPMKAVIEAQKPLEVIPDDAAEGEEAPSKQAEKVAFVADEDGAGKAAAKPEEKAPKIANYPPKITGGVYGDTVIPLGKIAKVNIRTIIIRACSICGHKSECWNAVKEALDEDDFKFNVDCIPGLEKMIKARGKQAPKLDSEFFAEYVKWT